MTLILFVSYMFASGRYFELLLFAVYLSGVTLVDICDPTCL